MSKFTKEYVIFYAKFEEAHPAGVAWKLSDISLDEKLKEVVIPSSYFPKSLLSFTIMKDKTLKCVVPEWLWDSKIEDANAFTATTTSDFDQFEKMYATAKTPSTQIEVIDRLEIERGIE